MSTEFVTLVELLTLCAVGSQPALEAKTQRALGQIIQITSMGQPTWVHNATTGESYTPTSTEDAIAIARSLERSGHTVYVGISALNTVWLERYGYDLEQSFDACTELTIASEVLGTLIQKRRPKSQDDWHQLFAIYLEPIDERRTTQANISMSARIALAEPLAPGDEHDSFAPKGSYTLHQDMTVIAPVFPTQATDQDDKSKANHTEPEQPAPKASEEEKDLRTHEDKSAKGSTGHHTQEAP